MKEQPINPPDIDEEEESPEAKEAKEEAKEAAIRFDWKGDL